MSRPQDRLQFVDLLRSFCILVVLAIHLGGNYITQPSPWPFLQTVWYKFWINGGYGVTIFFVLSGFVITRLIASGPGGLFKPDFRDFYSRRAGRILPLLLATCLLGVSLLLFFPSPDRPYGYIVRNPQALFSLSFWLSLPTFTFYWFKPLWPGASASYGLHWDILWSLSVEEQFYFAYPFVLKWLATGKKLKTFLLVLIFFPPIFKALQSFYFPKTEVPVLESLAPFGALATGCLLYLAFERFQKVLTRDPKAAWGTFLLGLVLFLGTYLHQDYKADVLGHILDGPGITWGTFFLVLGGLHLEIFRTPWFRPATWPGILCYGGYLLHPMMLYWLWPRLTGLNDFVAFFIFAAVTFALAYLSYRFYEVPMNHWVRKTFGTRRHP